jgi:translation initiation factor 2 subunit 3
MKVAKQPEVNIGMVGHVDHGKTTLTQALTGEWTDRHSEEVKRGISIKLGYADAAFYKCPKCQGTEAFTIEPEHKRCGGTPTQLIRTVSFVDSPGHETLMATMLSGAAIMDGAVLLIGANEPCPRPQTKEHLMALNIIGVKNIVIVQNKVDLVSEDKALQSYNEIKAFVKGTVAENAPVVPISAQQKVNLEPLIEAIERIIPTPKRDATKPSRMPIARSFDINLPGTRPKDLKGGVLGGSVSQGKFKVGDEIEIIPGIKIEDHGKVRWEPLRTTITGLMTGGQAYPGVDAGGLVGMATKLDPALTKSDNLAGKMAGKPGTLPPMTDSLTMEVHLLDRVVGAADELQVEPVKTREPLMLNVGTATTVGIVTSARKDDVDVQLKLPVVSEPRQRVAISRRIGARWRLIGFGVVK